MQKYASNVQDKSGNAVGGASVLVTDGTGATASLYAGPTLTSEVQANPIITAADGEYAFYAPNGRYSISVTARGFIGDAATDLLLYDPAEPYQPIDATIADSAASAFVSKQAAANSAAAAEATRAQTAQDQIATAADRAQTGLDRAQTDADAATATAKAAEAASNAAAVARDGSGGVAGLTGYAINLWNAAKTFKSSLMFSGTAARVHTFQDRDGTIADDTDLATKANTADLAASSGATMLKRTGTGGRLRSLDDMWSDAVRVSDHALGSVAAPGVDETSLVQAAFDYAVSVSKPLWIDRAFCVSAVSLNAANGMTIISTGSLTGLAAGTYDAVLTIKNLADLTVFGRLPVSASYNSGYACAVAVYTDNATQAAKLDLSGIITVGAKLAWRIGRSTEPGALISEIKISGGYSYGCPAFIEAYGTQTVVNVIGYQAISDLGSNPAGWSALNRVGARAVGANIRFTGGETLLTDVTTGALCIIEPIADATNGNQYGSISFNGVEIESASQWALIQNPSAIGSLVAGHGGLSFAGCKGMHTQDLFQLISASDANFSGTIKIDSSNKFFSTAARTKANVSCAGSLCTVDVSDSAFGTNFVQGLSGITGGNARFSRRKIAEMSNAASQAFSSSAQVVVKYSNFTSDADTVRFSSNYAAASGVFTVPVGGLKDVEVFASLHTTVPSAPLDLAVFVNGSQMVPFPTNAGGASSNGWQSGTTYIGNLAAGATIDVRAMQSGSASNSNGGALEKFIIYARN